MKKLCVIIAGMLLSICGYAQKHIIVAFDVTYSMVRDNRKDVKENRWDPAIQDLENILAAADSDDYIVIIPFQNQDATWIQPIKGNKSSLNWDDIRRQLENYINPKLYSQKNTSIKHAWELSRAEFPLVEDYEFYLITDGDEDHDNDRDVVSPSEERAIKCIRKYISEFKGKGYYSSLNSVKNGLPSEFDIFNDLYKSGDFKMKVPGKWDSEGTLNIRYEDLVSSGKTVMIGFRPIGSVQGKRVDFSGTADGNAISVKGLKISQDKHVQVSNVSSSGQLNTLSLMFSAQDANSIQCNTNDGYRFRTRIYNEWQSSGKYVIYDKFIDVCVIRPELIGVTTVDTVSYTLRNGVLESDPEVELTFKDNLLNCGVNMRNVTVVNGSDVKISLKGNEIVNGKAIFVLDEKNSRFTDGESEFIIELRQSDANAFFRFRPIQVTVRINSENDKTISITSRNDNDIRLKYRKGLFARVDTSEQMTIEYTLSDYLKTNLATISPHVEFKVESSSNALKVLNDAGQAVNEHNVRLEQGYKYRFTLDQENIRRGDRFTVKVLLTDTDGIEQVRRKRKPVSKDVDGNYIIEEFDIRTKKQLSVFAWLLIGLLSLLGFVVFLFAMRRALAPRFAKDHQFAFKTTNPTVKNFTFPVGQQYAQGNALEISKARKEFIRHFVLYNETYVKHFEPYGRLSALWNGEPKYVRTNFEQYEHSIEKIVITPLAGERIRVQIHYKNKACEKMTFKSEGFTITPWVIPNVGDVSINYGRTATPNNRNN